MATTSNTLNFQNILRTEALTIVITSLLAGGSGVGVGVGVTVIKPTVGVGVKDGVGVLVDVGVGVRVRDGVGVRVREGVGVRVGVSVGVRVDVGVAGIGVDVTDTGFIVNTEPADVTVNSIAVLSTTLVLTMSIFTFDKAFGSVVNAENLSAANWNVPFGGLETCKGSRPMANV